MFQHRQFSRQQSRNNCRHPYRRESYDQKSCKTAKTANTSILQSREQVSLPQIVSPPQSSQQIIPQLPNSDDSPFASPRAEHPTSSSLVSTSNHPAQTDIVVLIPRGDTEEGTTPPLGHLDSVVGQRSPLASSSLMSSVIQRESLAAVVRLGWRDGEMAFIEYRERVEAMMLERVIGQGGC